MLPYQLFFSHGGDDTYIVDVATDVATRTAQDVVKSAVRTAVSQVTGRSGSGRASRGRGSR